MAKKNSKLYTNGINEIYINDGDLIPDGYEQVKIFYINDGVSNKRWYDKDNIPDGFVIGKLPLSRNWKPEQHKHHTEDAKKNISESKKGKGVGEENPFYGCHHSDETKQLLRDLKLGKEAPNKGVRYTDEQKNLRNKHIIEKYGSLELFYYQSTQKVKKTKEERYGNANYNNIEKVKSTTFEHHGVDFYCMTNDYRKGHGNTSKYNANFKALLESYSLYVNDNESKEFPIHNYLYDFKVGNTLIEINPTVTHNSTFGVFNDPPKDRKYHYNKSKTAAEYGYFCLHIWDWDSAEKVIQRFIINKTIYARKCVIKNVSTKDTKEFLIHNHLQGTCNNQSVRLGLYYNDELVQLMTFGKPRYNKNYEYELLRLCTKLNYKIIGGSERLFHYFIVNYSPDSIISYCDNSKFNGDVYTKLNFTLKTKGNPSKHWYNSTTRTHITDNLLLSRGFDQLFGTNYGRGTSNRDLMIEHGFVEIYDCGQSTYFWRKYEQ